MIRFIVHIIQSKRDIYGNTYGIATITSTKSGNSISINLGNCPDNARWAVKHALNMERLEVSTSSEIVPIREYNRIAARHNKAMYVCTGTELGFAAALEALEI